MRVLAVSVAEVVPIPKSHVSIISLTSRLRDTRSVDRRPNKGRLSIKGGNALPQSKPAPIVQFASSSMQTASSSHPSPKVNL